MLDIHEIEDEIKKIENGDTTFANCEKLAILYTVREHMKGDKASAAPDIANDVTQELSDILPRYRTYCEVKKRYQLHEINEQPVIYAMGEVCREIMEFVKTLYASTDMEEERDKLRQTVAVMQTMF